MAPTRQDRPLWFQIRSVGGLGVILGVVIGLSPLWMPGYTILDLVVSEGLVIYLKPDDVASLARDLHAARHFQWWLFDLASPRLLESRARTITISTGYTWSPLTWR